LIADRVLESALSVAPASDPPGPISATLMYEQHYESIFRYARARVSSQALAEDLTSEVFCKAVAGLPRYRPLRPSTLPWLYTIASHQVADHYRRARPGFDLLVAEQIADPNPNPADLVASRDLVNRVWLASEALPPAQRRAVWLRYGEELELTEIAARMGRSVGAVKLLVHRGLRGVRAGLGSDQEGAPVSVSNSNALAQGAAPNGLSGIGSALAA